MSGEEKALTKPADHGGLNLSRFTSSYAIAAFMIVCIWFTSRKSKDDAGLPRRPGARGAYL